MNTQLIKSTTTLLASTTEAKRAIIKFPIKMSMLNFKVLNLSVLFLFAFCAHTIAQVNCTSPGVFESKPCLYVTDQVTDAEYCTGESYIWAVDGVTYTAAGQYTVAQTDQYGCPYQAILNLTENTSCYCCIGDLVWGDINANGVQEATELGIPDVTVLLFDANTGVQISSRQTDATGNYLFEGLTCGEDYLVRVDTTTFPQIIQNGGIYVSQFLIDYFGGGNCTDGSAWGATENGEYIEITGVPGTSVGCWVVSDGDGAITLPPAAVIPPDGVLVLCGGCDSIPNCDYPNYVSSTSTNMGFANSNDMIVIMDPTGNVVFSLEFGTNTDNTIPAINPTYAGVPCLGFPAQTITPMLSLGNLSANQAYILQANGSYVGMGTNNDGHSDLGIANGPGVPSGLWTQTYDFDGNLDHQSMANPPVAGQPDPNCDLRHDFGYTDQNILPTQP